MTAGTKAILLLSVFGLVVLVACYGDGPSSNQADQAMSGRSADPLLASASEISSPRQRIPAQRPPARQSTPRPPAMTTPSSPTQMSPAPVPARSVKVVRETSPNAPTFTMGAVRMSGIKAPSTARGSADVRAGAGVGRAPASTVASSASETKEESRPIQAKKADPVKTVAVHVIKPGDTLGHIAQKYYGSASKWSRIADANPKIDVNALRVGQELQIPARVVSATAGRPSKRQLPLPTGRTHTIDEGETLSSIAEDHLGDQIHWYRLYELNKDRIGSSPDRLVVGMVIAVPE